MSEPTTVTPPRVAPDRNRRRFRVSALLVIVIALGLIVWLALRDTNDSTTNVPADVTAVSPEQIAALAASVGHPVFWVGPKEGVTYELKRTPDGSIYLRYLPEGVKLGAKEGYLTVGTYPFVGAHAAIKTIAKEPGITAIKLSHGGLAEVTDKKPTNVHAAYPGVDYQIEIFDPTGNAAALTKARLAAFGSLSSTAPEAASVARLKSVAKSVGHPIYWAGPRKGNTYELTQKADGQILIRYLPPGTNIGASGQFLTVGTYPAANAFDAMQALAKEPDAVVISAPGGAIAVAEPRYRKNIHLAYPGSDYQLEVFAPSPVTARRIVSSGQVKSIG